MIKKISILALIVLLASPIVVFAAGDVIRVVPVGKPETGMAIITSSPASLQLFVTSAQQPRSDIWLLFLIDEATYNGLTTITLSGTEGPATIAKGQFTTVTVNSGKLPLESDGNYTGGVHTYPGCTKQTRWSVSAILSQMSQLFATTSVRYLLVYAFDSINTTPKPFTVTVNSPHINVLVLAQGRDGGKAGDPLNSNSPFSGSTLITPELGPIVLSLASFGAFAVYAIKRKKQN
jgi:hypothetical protein